MKRQQKAGGSTLQTLYQYGPHQLREWRENLLRKHSKINKLIVAEFKKRAGEGALHVADANRWFGDLDRYLQIGGASGISSTASDEDKVSYADTLAKSINMLFRETHGPGAFSRAAEYAIDCCLRHGFDFPADDIANPEHVRLALSKTSDSMWWRRKIRTASNRLVEEVMRDMGRTGVYTGLYVSNYSYRQRCQDQHRNQMLLELMSAVNQDGDEYTLSELAELGLSNPKNRHAEMIVRVKGLQAWAADNGHAAGFFTLTCPSRFHAMKKKPYRRNPKWNGSSVRDAHQYLVKVWQKVYSAWERAGINWYGMWISEPHHDGTPHRHGVIFCPPHQFRKMTRIFQEYAFGIHPCTKRQIETKVPRYRGICYLENAGGERGALKHRFEMERIWHLEEDADRAKRAGKKVSSVIAYVIKYISKNIATDAAKQVGLDEYGHAAEISCERVAAWAGIHGIRQFNFAKCPPVGVYRELRKLDADKEEDVQFWHGINQADDTAKALLANARAASDAGDFGRYLNIQGGPCLPRDAYPLKLWKIVNASADAATDEITAKRNRYGQITEGVYGLSVTDRKINHYMTRFNTWEIGQISRTEQSGGEAVTPRTCVNNSTLPEISAGEVEAIRHGVLTESTNVMVDFINNWEETNQKPWRFYTKAEIEQLRGPKAVTAQAEVNVTGVIPSLSDWMAEDPAISRGTAPPPGLFFDDREYGCA